MFRNENPTFLSFYFRKPTTLDHGTTQPCSTRPAQRTAPFGRIRKPIRASQLAHSGDPKALFGRPMKPNSGESFSPSGRTTKPIRASHSSPFGRSKSLFGRLGLFRRVPLFSHFSKRYAARLARTTLNRADSLIRSGEWKQNLKNFDRFFLTLVDLLLFSGNHGHFDDLYSTSTLTLTTRIDYLLT